MSISPPLHPVHGRPMSRHIVASFDLPENHTGPYVIVKITNKMLVKVSTEFDDIWDAPERLTFFEDSLSEPARVLEAKDAKAVNTLVRKNAQDWGVYAKGEDGVLLPMNAPHDYTDVASWGWQHK